MSKRKYNRNIMKCPVENLPRYARLFGVYVSVMFQYCAKTKGRDKLPRGLEDKMDSLREVIISKIEESKTEDIESPFKSNSSYFSGVFEDD